MVGDYSESCPIRDPVDAALTSQTEPAAVRYPMIPVEEMTAGGELAQALEADGLSDLERDALSLVFERTIQTCELLVTYAVAVARKPSTQ